MSKYLNNNTSEILSMGQVRKLFKNVSLPKVFTQDTYDALNIIPILPTPKPEASSPLKQYVKNGVTTDANGNTVEAWIEVDMFSDTPEATKAEQEAAYLESLKIQKKQSMKQARQTAIDGTYSVTVTSGTYEIDVDSNSRSNIHQTIDNAELAGLTDTDTTMWKMADNNFYQLTYGELKLIGLQMAQFIQSQYAKEATKNAEIDAATIDTLENITWES